MKDITTEEDVAFLVNQFYDQVLKDELLSPFFKRLNFDKHLPKMIHFWSFVLLDEAGYTTDVTQKHMHMPLDKIHFERWILLFNETVDDNFKGENAKKAKERAFLVGWTIESKINSK